MAANRAPVKTLSKTAGQIAKNAQTEAERKKASKAALRAAAKAQNEATIRANPTEAEKAKATATPATPTPKDPAKLAAEEAAYRAALEVDAQALGHTTPEAIAAYVADQLKVTPDAKAAGYNGPMVILREAAKHYVRGIHCGDNLATILDGLSREAVVSIIGTFLVEQKVIEHRNPYLHLNPGQQSMNLRNKLRGAIKAGTVTEAAFRAAVAAATKKGD